MLSLHIHACCKITALNRFSVLEFLNKFWVCQIKHIDCTQHQCTGLCHRFDLLKNHYSINNNSNIIVVSKNTSFLFNDTYAYGFPGLSRSHLFVLYLNKKKLLLDIVLIHNLVFDKSIQSRVIRTKTMAPLPPYILYVPVYIYTYIRGVTFVGLILLRLENKSLKCVKYQCHCAQQRSLYDITGNVLSACFFFFQYVWATREI